MKISKTRAMRISGNNIQRVKTEVDVKIIEQFSEIKYLGNTIFFDSKCTDFKIQTYNKKSGITRYILEDKCLEKLN